MYCRKKIPKNSEGSTVLLGGIPNLRHTLSFFVRLDEASSLGDLTEVTVPTKFIYLLFYPSVSEHTHSCPGFGCLFGTVTPVG